ncbi:MAG: AAA family ATPase [Sideroxydans sp.]|nr:AAA family ATPase [Sideroxydans sp.]
MQIENKTRSDKLMLDLRSHVKSHYPLIYLVTQEDEVADSLIAELAEARGIIEWNMARGMVRFDTKQPFEDAHLQDLSTALLHMIEQDYERKVIVLRDVHVGLRDNPVAVARLKALAMQFIDRHDSEVTIFLVSPQVFVPQELEKFVVLFELPLPDKEVIRAMLDEFVQLYEVVVDEGTRERLVMSFQGLTRYEIGQLLLRSYQSDGEINGQDVELIQEAKAQIIQKGGSLELVKSTEELKSIGGLKSLKAWLKQKDKVLQRWPEASRFGVDAPKGIMVVGMPGCGKSLTAKAASNLFRLPLLRLDMGSMMGKYVGESEGNLRRALSLAEAVSPCVLWVDEVEKAFVGIGGGGANSEVATRMFGYFLTWMQEKTSHVFVIATANDISALPPELLRKGRFDEIFYVDFPNDTERKEIFRLHLAKRANSENRINDSWENISLDDLVAKSVNYSGADIEAAVKDAIEKAFVDGGKTLDTERLMAVLRNTHPLGEIMKDKVKEIKAKFDAMKIKKAS